MRVYMFYDDIATECGVNASVMFYSISQQVKCNETNGTNFRDGRYWTYNSVEGFSKQFPFLSAKQVRTALEKLENHGYVLTGNYNRNEMPFNHTKWYTLTEKGRSVL